MKKLILIAFMGISLGVSAQKIKLIEGDLSPLKGQTSVNTEFVYDGMLVTTKNVPEDEYLATKTAEYNKKEAGKGDKWAISWKEDRKTRFEPQFRELFVKHSGMTTASDEKAQYTLIFKTTSTETGYNIGISKRPAYIDGELWIVETANKDKVIAKISILNVVGSQFGGYDFETGARLQECYAKAGKELAGFIKSKTKK